MSSADVISIWAIRFVAIIAEPAKYYHPHIPSAPFRTTYAYICIKCVCVCLYVDPTLPNPHETCILYSFSHWPRTIIPSRENLPSTKTSHFFLCNGSSHTHLQTHTCSHKPTLLTNGRYFTSSNPFATGHLFTIPSFKTSLLHTYSRYDVCTNIQSNSLLALHPQIFRSCMPAAILPLSTHPRPISHPTPRWADHSAISSINVPSFHPSPRRQIMTITLNFSCPRIFQFAHNCTLNIHLWTVSNEAI